MKHLFSLVLIISVFSCQKGDTTISSSGTRIQSIFNGVTGIAEQQFMYSANGLVERIEIVGDSYYEIKYDNDKVIEIKHTDVDSGIIRSQESITYNASGQIDTVYSTSHPMKYWFEYNAEGQPIKRLQDREDSELMTEYFWNNDNVEKVIYYWYGEIVREDGFEHDDQENFRKDIPFVLSTPEYWNQNNIIKVSSDKIHSTIFFGRTYISGEYTYNDDGYPIYIKDEKLNKEFSLIYD